MKIQGLFRHHFRGRFLTVLVLIMILVLIKISAWAQDQSPVIITADQPNIWTLEQAHYLLAQMHRRNIDLRASPLGDLDANAINGVNIDVLKSLLEVSAEYDQSKAINNGLRLNQKRFDTQRRTDLITQRAQREDESLQLTRQIADLEIKKAQTDSPDEQAKIQAEIDQRKIVQMAVKDQIAQINTDLGTLSTVSGDFEKTAPDEAALDSKKMDGALDSAFGTTVKTVMESFQNSPQLNASLRLESYLQMQYEILSKQLTLLRDEVGPGERLLFLEMPQSIKASYSKADNKWAQSWWKIRAYTTCDSVESDYKMTAVKIGGVAREIRKMNDLFLGVFPANEDTLYPPNLQTELQQARLSLLEANNKTYSAADLGRRIAAALEANRTQFSTEVAGSEQQLKSVFADALKSTNLAISRLSVIVVKKAIYTAVPKPRLSSAVVGKQIDLLSGNINRLRSAELLTSHAWYMRLVNERYQAAAGHPLWDALTSQLDGDAVQHVVDKLPAASPIPCNGSQTSYRDTASVLSELIKGDTYRDIDVVDLDEGIDTSRSPLAKILTETVQTADRGGDIVSRPGPVLENREARVVDMFPRQSSLNVNDLNLQDHKFSVMGIFSIIAGFGTRIDYQRSREKYSQFVQQELYSSAFGKGSREFGWTFNPMPGTKRLMSGARTTYAIVVVPRKATTILLQSIGCYFDRSEKQLPDFYHALQFHKENNFFDLKEGNCSDSKSFLVPIPSAISSEDSF
jgi:hypothetical protein